MHGEEATPSWNESFAEHVQNRNYQVAKECKDSRIFTTVSAVFIERNIAHVMHLVFDAPMSAIEGQESLRGCLLGRKTGDKVSHLDFNTVFYLSYAFDVSDLPDAREEF